MDRIIARFHCDQVGEKINQWNPSYKTEELVMSVTTGGTPEDQVFYQSSPGGELKLTIANQAAMGFFKPGKKYNVIFEPVEEDNGI